MLLILVVVGFVLFTILVFASPKLSVIPYFPTASTDLLVIKRALNLQKNNILYDLGAGDGKIIFSLKQNNVKVVGVETNPYLILFMHLRRLFAHNKKQIVIVWQSLFSTNLQEATHIYLFVGPYLIDDIIEYILKNKGQKLKKIVSYRYFPKKSRSILNKAGANLTELTASHPVYVWEFKTSL